MTPEPLDILAYLDDVLDDNERAAFEEALARDSALRDDVEQYCRIEDSLRRTMAAPDQAALAAIVERALASSPSDEPNALRQPPRRTLGRVLAAAAAIALLVTGVWLTARGLANSGRPGLYAPHEVRTPWQAWGDAQRGGFEPDWICRDNSEFSEVFERRLGMPLAFDATVDGSVRALGVSYANVLSGLTTCVLVEADGEDVLVLADRASRAIPDLSPRDGLFAHQRVLGDIVLIEVSRRDRVAALERFRLTPAPENEP